jgi:hypothetical protein
MEMSIIPLRQPQKGEGFADVTPSLALDVEKPITFYNPCVDGAQLRVGWRKTLVGYFFKRFEKPLDAWYMLAASHSLMRDVEQA